MHQVIYKLIVTKGFDNKVLGYIYPWGETLAYIGWVIRASYHHTIGSISGQAVFGRDMIFNVALVVDWKVINPNKKYQLDIDNLLEKDRRVTHY